MKITEIKVQNVLGIRQAHIALNKPVTLFAGPNGAGKSSLRAAIRMAFTGSPERVSLKKDYKQLVTDGNKTGLAAVWVDGEMVGEIKLPTGDHGESLPAGVNFPRLNALLVPESFAAMADKERRKFLFDLMNLQLDQQSIVKRMLEKGCAPELVEIIKPMLRTGFEAASSDAGTRMTEAKGAWRAITGEAWGSNKAEGWESALPQLDASLQNTDPVATEQLLAKRREELDAENQAIGGMMGKVKAAAAAEANKNGLRQKAGQIGRIEDKLKVDQAEVIKWDDLVKQTEALAAGGQPEPHHECPTCNTLLQVTGAGLVVYTPPEKVASPEAAAKLGEYRRALALYESAVANDNRDLAEARNAQAQLDALEDAEAAPTDEEQKAQAEKIASIKVSIAELETQKRAIEAAKQAVVSAESTTTKAAEHHKAVLGWQFIAETLSPSGIPGELLAGALTPINDLLREFAGTTGWKQVAIDAEMNILASGRGYHLLCESERWRVDAMIATAISILSGINMLFLDRIDVLDLPARAALMLWLDKLAASGRIDTALLFGTLKAIPAGLPAQCEGFWLENGTVNATAQQVAA